MRALLTAVALAFLLALCVSAGMVAIIDLFVR